MSDPDPSAAPVTDARPESPTSPTGYLPIEKLSLETPDTSGRAPENVATPMSRSRSADVPRHAAASPGGAQQQRTAAQSLGVGSGHVGQGQASASSRRSGLAGSTNRADPKSIITGFDDPVKDTRASRGRPSEDTNSKSRTKERASERNRAAESAASTSRPQEKSVLRGPAHHSQLTQGLSKRLDEELGSYTEQRDRDRSNSSISGEYDRQMKPDKRTSPHQPRGSPRKGRRSTASRDPHIRSTASKSRGPAARPARSGTEPAAPSRETVGPSQEAAALSRPSAAPSHQTAAPSYRSAAQSYRSAAQSYRSAAQSHRTTGTSASNLRLRVTSENYREILDNRDYASAQLRLAEINYQKRMRHQKAEAEAEAKAKAEAQRLQSCGEEGRRFPNISRCCSGSDVL